MGGSHLTYLINRQNKQILYPQVACGRSMLLCSQCARMREEPAAHEHLVLAEIPTEKQKVKRNPIFVENIGLCSDKLFEMK